MSNEYLQFRLRQQELEQRARHERQVNEVRQDQAKRQERRQSKQNSLLSRVSVLF